MTEYLISNFSNRELAIGFWLLAFVFVFLFFKETWSFLREVAEIILLRGLLQILLLLLLINTCLVCYGLTFFGWWQPDQIKSLIPWYFMTGIKLLFNAVKAEEGDRFFEKVIFDNFKIFMIFEFIVFEYSFPFVIEIIIFPIIFILSLFLLFSEKREEFVRVKHTLNWLLFIYVLFVAWNSISIIYNEPETFLNEKTARDFFLPIFLTIGCFPYFYFLFVWNHIQLFNIKMNQNHLQESEKQIPLQKYGKRRFLLNFWYRPWLLRKAARQFDCLQAKNKKDVENIIQEIISHEQQKNHPPKVEIQNGWSPYLAGEFLSDFGLKTGDYHKDVDGKFNYYATSETCELSFMSYITYYVEGTQNFATSLRIKNCLDNDDNNITENLKAFSKISITLYKKATGKNLSEKQIQELILGNPFNDQNGTHLFSLSEDEWSSGKCLEFKIKLK